MDHLSLSPFAIQSVMMLIPALGFSGVAIKWSYEAVNPPTPPPPPPTEPTPPPPPPWGQDEGEGEPIQWRPPPLPPPPSRSLPLPPVGPISLCSFCRIWVPTLCHRKLGRWLGEVGAGGTLRTVVASGGRGSEGGQGDSSVRARDRRAGSTGWRTRTAWVW